jgi:hypothetical protein
MPKESRQNRKKGRSQGIMVDSKTIKSMRALSDGEAFHFYETMNKPTGQSAKSLHEFLDKIESIKLESLVFHLERNDFKNWIENTIGDQELAKKIEMIPARHDEKLRMTMQTTVRNRLKELEEMPMMNIEESVTIPV